MKSLRHPLRARSREHHTIDRLEEADKEQMAREEALNDLERSEKGLSSTGTTGKLFSRATLGNNSERRGGAHKGFPERVDAIFG